MKNTTYTDIVELVLALTKSYELDGIFDKFKLDGLLQLLSPYFKFAAGELEITDLNKIYLEKGNLDVELLGQGFTWLDTGTHESLVDATNFVKTVETHQNRKIACLEEIAYNNGWISKDELNTAYELYKKNQYGKYLKDVMDGKFIDQ